MSDPAPKKDSTVEEHAASAGTPSWQLAGLRARHGWAIGKTLTRAEYDQALEKWLTGPTVAQPDEADTDTATDTPKADAKGKETKK